MAQEKDSRRPVVSRQSRSVKVALLGRPAESGTETR
jgi:hypothetical protein